MRPTALAALLALAALAFLALGARAAPGLEAPELLQDHAPIRIDRDADFDAAHGVRGGSGTDADPYLIANWRVKSDVVHVRVANTTKAFMVRNNDLEGQCNDVPLNCTLEAGVHIVNVTGRASVLHNRVAKMERAGITVWGAPGAVVDDNLVDGGGTVPWAPPPSPPGGIGILVLLCDDAEVVGNRVLDVGARGAPGLTAAVRVMFSNRTLVEGNEVRGATEFGLSLVGVQDVVVQDNELVANGNGTAFEGFHGVMRYNNLTDNAQYGILLASGRNWLRAEGNLLARNGGGMEVRGPANGTLRGNSFEANRDFGVSVAGDAWIDASDNWWGAADGPNLNGSGPGTGQAIVLVQANATQVALRPWLTAAPVLGSVGAHALRTGSTVSAEGPRPSPGDPTPVAVLEGPGLLHPGEMGWFSAARSADPQGGPMRYAWDFGDGGTGAGLRAAHIYQATGEFVVSLTVTDDQSLASTAKVAVHVVRTPLGVVLTAPLQAFRGENITLGAVATGQPLAPATFRFTTGGPGTFSGAASAVNRTTARFDEAGAYFVGVEAVAGEERASAFERVQVLNRAPKAVVAVAPSSGDTRTAFSFSAEGSGDLDGDALEFTWDFGGGATERGFNVSHRFDSAGTHLVVLTVSDGAASASVNTTVEVAAASAAPESKGTPAAGTVLAMAALGLAAAGRRRLRPGR